MVLLMLLIHVFCIVFVIFGKIVLLYCYANKSLESWIYILVNVWNVLLYIN